jgi:hypothetical protein
LTLGAANRIQLCSLRKKYFHFFRPPTSHLPENCVIQYVKQGLIPLDGMLDGEILLPCALPELAERYLVSNMGRIVSLVGTPKVLRPQDNGIGYKLVALCAAAKTKLYLVHRLVAATFLGECPDGKECHHRNHDKADNRASNLAYVTHHQNILEYWAQKRLNP